MLLLILRTHLTRAPSIVSCEVDSSDEAFLVLLVKWITISLPPISKRCEIVMRGKCDCSACLFN